MKSENGKEGVREKVEKMKIEAKSNGGYAKGMRKKMGGGCQTKLPR